MMSSSSNRIATIMLTVIAIALLGCNSGNAPTQAPSITQIVAVTQIIPVTQIVLVTQVISINQVPEHQTAITPEAPASNQLFGVSATQGWQDMGITVQAGDQMVIEYVSGSWTPWLGGHYEGIGVIKPEYRLYEYAYDANSILQGVPHGCLIGRIEGNPPFYVGNQYAQTITQSGPLYLRINDGALDDNGGSLQLRIYIVR